MPYAQVSSIIALCVVMLCLIFLGFIAGITESKIAIETYTIILILCTLAMVAQSSLVTYYADSFNSYYDSNWGKLMIHVHKDFYNVDTMHCYGGKYVKNYNSTSFYNLKCDNKNEIAYMWENEYQKNI